MTDPVRPPGATDRRAADRRQALRRAKTPGDGRDLVPVSPVIDAAHPLRKEPDSPAFAAQLLGQDGKKRGLKGGQEVLDQARSTYLKSEYAGSADRRPAPGQVRKSEI